MTGVRDGVKVDIRQIDANDEAQFRPFFEALDAADRAGRDEVADVWTYRQVQVTIGVAEETEEWRAYAAYEGDEVVGVGLMILFLLDNLDKAFVLPLTPPAQRGRGIGSAMMEHLLRVARDAGRTTAMTEAYVPVDQRDDHPYVAFATRHGFRFSNVEIRRRLDLPVPDETLDALEAEAAPHHHGFRFETFVDELPEPYIESFASLISQLVVDAPTGELDFEARVVSAETLRARQQKTRDQGIVRYETVAINEQNEAVAQSTLGVPGDDDEVVFQWGTYVAREVRGHRLGMAVKVRNLRAMQQANPDRRHITTQNAEQNGPMVAINERIGFRPIEAALDLIREIGSDS